MEGPEAAVDTVQGCLEAWARSRPAELAMVAEDGALSWGDLKRVVDQWSAALIRVGVRRGARIAVLSPPGIEPFVLYLAALRVGAVFVGLNPRHRLRELEHIVGETQPRLLFAIGRFAERDYRGDVAALRPLVQSEPIWLDDPASVALFIEGTDHSPLDQLDRPTRPVDPACVIYTSGSTGSPKGAVLSAHGLIANARAVVPSLSKGGAFRCQTDHPIDHVGGIDRLYFTLVTGGAMFIARRFDARNVLDMIERHRLSLWYGELTQFVKAEPFLDEFDLSSLEVALYVGPASRDLIGRLRRVAGRLVTAYGMTELSSASHITDETTTADQLSRGAVGRPLDVVLTRIVDDEGVPVAPGEPGELQVRSSCVFLEYLGRPEATAGAFTSDGWFRTGDLLREDDDGLCYFVGRIGSMFKSGGYNIYPEEIESVLKDHVEVADAAVVPMPDPVFQSVGWAFVQPVVGSSPDINALDLWLRERLAGYKVPKRLELMAELPKLSNQKVDKTALAAAGAALRSASMDPSSGSTGPGHEQGGKRTEP